MQSTDQQAYDTVSEALAALLAKGYTEDFNLAPTCLMCPGLQLEIHPEDFEIDEVHRFEGMSNPDDNSVVFAISSKSGVRGVLVDAYGMYSEAISPAMAAKLRR